MNIEDTLKYHDKAIRMLLKRYRIYGPVTMDKINEAHSKYGEDFMIKLLQIVTPETSNFTALTGLATTAAVEATQLNSTTQTGGKFWSFMDKLLGTVDRTGYTISNFKSNIDGSNSAAAYDLEVKAMRNRNIMIGAVVLIVLVLTILLISKKK